MPKDLYSVLFVQSQKRVWSFLAQATGLMVDADLGTENIRWMGDVRFTLGFIKGVAVSRNHKCRMRMRVTGEDKIEMARTARTWATKVMDKRALGGGTDPLDNKVKKLDLGNGHGDNGIKHDGEGGAASGSGAESIPEEGEEDGDGPLPAAKLLQPDETWTTIETGTKAAISKAERDAKAAETGKAGAWVDGEGVLYA